MSRRRRGVDRRFFREAYEGDAILSDLATNVRTIVETRPLLETVATRSAESLHVPRIAILLDDAKRRRSLTWTHRSGCLPNDSPMTCSTYECNTDSWKIRMFRKRWRKRASRLALDATDLTYFLERETSIYIIELARTCLRQPSAYAPLYVGQRSASPA